MESTGSDVAKRPAAPSRARAAALLDFAAAFVVAVIVFPFPFARAALPLPVFVVSILATIVVAHVLYVVLTMIARGRTPGMYLLDLGLSGPRPDAACALRWGLGSVIAFWPTLLGVAGAYDPDSGIAQRMSGRRLVSTAREEAPSDREDE